MFKQKQREKTHAKWGFDLGFQQYISSLRKRQYVQKKHSPYKTVACTYVTP